MLGGFKRLAFYCIRLVGGFAIAKHLTRTHLRILCYHGFSIGDEHELAPYVFMRPQTFSRRMRILRERGLNVIPIAEAIERLRADEITNAETVITFDDGWASDLLVMPVLESYRFPVCIYITSEHLSAGTQAFNVTLAQMVHRSQRESISLRDIHPEIDGDYKIASDRAGATAKLLAGAARIESLQVCQRLLAPLAEALGLDVNQIRRFVSQCVGCSE